MWSLILIFRPNIGRAGRTRCHMVKSVLIFASVSHLAPNFQTALLRLEKVLENSTDFTTWYRVRPGLPEVSLISIVCLYLFIQDEREVRFLCKHFKTIVDDITYDFCVGLLYQIFKRMIKYSSLNWRVWKINWVKLTVN